MIVLIENVIMIKSDSEHEQSISGDKNFFALANQNSIIKKILMSMRFFKKNSEFEFNLSSWKSIKNDDLNNQNFSDWFSTELSLMNKILNKNSCQSESIMSEVLESDDNYLWKLQ